MMLQEFLNKSGLSVMLVLLACNLHAGNDFGDKHDLNFFLFPNPNDGTGVKVNFVNEYIETEEVLLVLFDIVGNEIYSKLIITADGLVNVVDLDTEQTLSAGIYFITASSDRALYKQKLIVM